MEEPKGISSIHSAGRPARSVYLLKELISSATNDHKTGNLSEELASLDVHKAHYEIDIELG